MKQIINTTGLFLLISLPSFAGTQDSTRKDSCCTTGVVKASVLHTSDNTAPLAPSAADFAQAAATLKVDVANADAEMTFAYAAQHTDRAAIAHADALTDLQVSASAMGDVFNKTSGATARNADKLLTAAHQKAVSLDVDAFRGENLTKMLIASDKAMHQLSVR